MSDSTDPAFVEQLAADIRQVAHGKHAVDAASFLSAHGDVIADIVAAAAPAPIEWPLVEEFGRSVSVPGGELDRLELREPTVNDLLKHGILDGSIDGERIVNLVGDLSGKPAPVIKAIPGKVILRLSTKLTRFFAEAAR